MIKICSVDLKNSEREFGISESLGCGFGGFCTFWDPAGMIKFFVLWIRKFRSDYKKFVKRFEISEAMMKLLFCGFEKMCAEILNEAQNKNAGHGFIT